MSTRVVQLETHIKRLTSIDNTVNVPIDHVPGDAMFFVLQCLVQRLKTSNDTLDMFLGDEVGSGNKNDHWSCGS